MSRNAPLPASLALVATFALASDAANAIGGRVASGRDLARLVPPAGAVVEPYANAGYALRFTDGAVEVSVDLAPLESRWPFTPPARFASAVGSPDRLAEVARLASSGATTRYAAVSGVLGWIAENVQYELDRGLSQEPGDVLARRSGYCTGIARLAVALLSALEIESREVPGYRFADGVEGGTATSGFHRWIEVFYPDRGWVFSDPAASHQFVPATYLRLSAERLEIAPGDGVLLDRLYGIEEIDLDPVAPARVLVRPNSGLRGSAALVVRLAGRGDGEALLEGEGVRRTARIAGGDARFLGLTPGRYELSVSAGGRLAAHKLLTFRGPVLGELTISTGAGPVAGGGMR